MIQYTKPSITDLEVEYAIDAARNGWGAECYKYIERFENLFSSFVGTQYSVATSSCTGALHLGLAALGIKPGDEVIIADTNWVASVAPVVHLGATPVFVDILPDTWCLDPDRVEAAITPRTKAVIAVHLYGNICDIEKLIDICDRHNLALVEDCAEAIGSELGERQVGCFGRFSVFSFHGTKTLTTGEGGTLNTDDRDLYTKVQTLNSHGRVAEEPRHFWPHVIGYKYKMSNLQAAIGCAQLERAKDLVAAKRKVFGYYKKAFSDTTEISLNPEPPNTRNGYWMPTAVFSPDSGVTREKLLAAFERVSINARPFFYPLSSLPMFEPKHSNVISHSIPGRAVNLPSYPYMTESDQDRVIAVVRDVMS